MKSSGLAVALMLSAFLISPTQAAELEKMEEKKPPEDILKQVDGVFGTSVKWMEKVLFYAIAAEEQPYVVFQRQEFYTRDIGDKGTFKKYDPAGEYEKEELNEEDLKLLAARGKLIAGPEGADFRTGKIGEKSVEYVTLKLDDEEHGVKYGSTWYQMETANGEEYQKLGDKRELVDQDTTLSPALVKNFAEKGWLKTDSGNPDWLLKKTIGGVPVVVLWLSLGAVCFTIYMRFYNIWGFGHALQIVRGKYDNPDEAGEVTHFQALASALSATVGLGNIAGVTIAMTLGGPGAFFWMLLCGIFGMTSKFVECTLGQKYRMVKPDGTILGGPMRYLRAGLAEIGLAPLGIVLSIMFTIMCILASFGGGNMFQANQSGDALLATLQHESQEKEKALKVEIKKAAELNDTTKMKELDQERESLKKARESFATSFRIGFGLILAVLVGVVIIGGIKRIGAAAEKVVPTMCIMYVLACLYIIIMNYAKIPALLPQIFTEAFSGKAMGGGFVGVLVLGVRRAAFSNEAGVGSAAIAHSAAKTEEPVREGSVALLGPFIDTVVVCSMTALVILITDAWDNTQWVVNDELSGAALTSRAFREASPISEHFFPWMLSIAVVLFAYSTIISWSYYGERCWEILFGPRSTMVYKALTVICVFIGAIVNLGAVLAFSDMMILVMAFPNILGLFLLSPKVRKDLVDYWKRYKAGEFKTFK